MEELFGNQFLQGGLALAFMGAVIAAIRYAPEGIWHLVQRYWAVTITTRDQTLIQWISVWLANTEYGKRCQWLDVATFHKIDGLSPIIRPGIGLHSFKKDGVRYWIIHQLEDQGVVGKINVLSMRVLGRDPAPLRAVIQTAIDMANAERVGKNVIYINSKWGDWEQIRLFPNRFKESLFLRQGLIEEILADASDFLEDADWYRVRGLPYRRGYLFYGPAGNGKSTIIQTLASELGLPIYLLSLSDPEMTDYGLAKALGHTPDKCLVVIEDFEKIDLSGTAVTQGGFLNSIDGPLASEGRLLVLTANTIDNISEYFLRPGRVDREWEISEPSRDAIKACLDVFSPDGAIDKSVFIQEALMLEWSMAEVQKELIVRMEH